MSKKNQMLAGIILVLPLLMFQVLNASPRQDDRESVAWYAANIIAAKQQNQCCHDNPELQYSPACINSLHALQISFSGAN